MYDNYYNEDYLMHYGVKGMKWGVRSARGHAGPGMYLTRKRQLAGDKRDLAYMDKGGHLSVGLTKKRQAAYDKRDRAALEKRIARNEKVLADKEAKKAVDAAQDRKIMNARQKQSDSVAGLKKEAKNFALATVSGDKKGKISATRNASKLVDSYISNKEVANRATSGERKVATAMAVIGGVTVAAAAAKHTQAGKRMANVMYPGLYYI